MAKEFEGIFPAADLEPTILGLFSVAHVTEHTKDDEKFVRGYSTEYDSRPTLNLLDTNGHSPDYQIFNGTSLPVYDQTTPFWIEVEDYRSTFGLIGEDRYARTLLQLKAASQKAVEVELFDGYVARAEGNTTNVYLTKAGNTLPATSPQTGVSTLHALLLLEDAIGKASPVGEHGVIHMTRGMTAVLGFNTVIIESGDNGSVLHSTNRTPIVVGNGYSGNGPLISVSNKVLTTNVVTLTTSTPHAFLVGETAIVSGVDAAIDGSYVVASTPSTTTLTFALTHADILTIASSGTIQMKATADTKWAYATGTVEVHLGDPEIVNDPSSGQGYDSSGNQNNMRIKSVRAAAVRYDPSIHCAVKVDLTKSA